MSMARLSTLLVSAALAAAALPAAAADFSPMVLRRADTQGLVSELFLYDLTALEIQQLRLRMAQSAIDDALAIRYEPTLADLVPASGADSGDKLLAMLRPASTGARGPWEDTVLIVFQGTTLHARRYRMASTFKALAAALPTISANGVSKAQQVAALKPDGAAEIARVADKNADKNANADANPAAFSDIAVAVKRWAKAWEQRDVAAYAAAYASDFRGEGTAALSASHAAWLAQRRERIVSKRDIEVVLEDIQISVQRSAPTDIPKANVRFVQRYRGDALRSVTRKRLGLVLRDGTWLIREEVTL
jgi:hypothetical protein